MKRAAAALVLFTAGVLIPASHSLAQAARYPDRAMRLINPFPPGGSVDVTARLIAPALSKSLGHVRKAIAEPATVKRLEQDALDVVGSTPEQLAAALESELKK